MDERTAKLRCRTPCRAIPPHAVSSLSLSIYLHFPLGLSLSKF
ncbi:hypothetical protein COLO4_16380 [Corchorus olitorius]|uniref:Uncharacterized protein n=1 Tax=Corchorus olitorius TaxID=93759 RepID=A0A1R3JHM4_9ROSI|nr:hypothetical protein COLO4_16380 [Corchorus olitorius]